MRKLANSAARDIASPAAKMGSKGLFPGVAVPLAFFCTLFFRHRKKSVSAPWDGKSQFAPESARQSPPGQEYAPAGTPKGFPLALWKPSGTEAGEKPMTARLNLCRVGASGPQSVRPALPRAPLVVCLNAFGSPSEVG